MRSIPERSGVDGAYGETRYTWGTTPTDYRFTGQRQTESLGLVHMGARWYDPYLGRWLSPDSIVPEPANPQSLNRFSYCLNDSLNATDPSGHKEINEDDAYQEAYSEEYYYCYVNPTSPGCQTNWEQVRDAGLLFLTAVAAPTLVGAGARYIAQVGGKAIATRLVKATVEELAESAITGRNPDPVNIGLDAVSEVLDDARVAGTASTQPPNPTGRRGGLPHSGPIEDITTNIRVRGLTPRHKYPVRLLGPGTEGKKMRAIDVAALDVNLNPVEFHQVGDMTSSGLPVARERRAIIDVTEFSDYTHVPLHFWPKTY